MDEKKIDKDKKGLVNRVRVAAGVLLLLSVPLWYTFFVDEIEEIPSDFTVEKKVDSYDNFYDPIRGVYLGEQRSLTDHTYRVLKGNSNELEIEHKFNVVSLTGQQIFAVSRLYHIDAHTGKHIPTSGPVFREGYLFAPQMKGLLAQVPDKSPFNYWHVNYNNPIRMEYRSTENLYGLELYKYGSTFVADQTEELTGSLLGVGEDKGISLDVRIEIWVEPYTGRILQYEDYAEAYFYDFKTKERLYPWNKFHNKTTNDSASDFAKQIQFLIQKQYFFEYTIPFLFVLVGCLLIFWPTILRRWRSSLEKKVNTESTNVAVPLLFGVLGLGLTLLVMVIVQSILKQQQNADFENEIISINDSITKRLQTYDNVLRGGRGLFDASQSVERDEWSGYVNSLNVERDYPGIQGFGFAQVIQPEDREKIVNQVRADGYPEFKITPEGERDIYTSIIYLEPLDVRNRRAFGYDMFSEETRRRAMEYARDSGGPALSGKVTLLQETGVDPQAGFLVYEPVYKPNATYGSVLERQSNIYGYVYAPFRMNNFMIGIFIDKSTKLGIEIYDGVGSVGSEEKLLYQNEFISPDPLFTQIQQLDLYNHTWTIRYTAPNGYSVGPVRSSLNVAISIAGIVISFLLFVFVYVLNTRRIKALQIAHSITGELEKFKLAVEDASDHIVITDPTGTILYANPAASRITGYGNKEIIGKRPGDLWGGFMGKQFYKTMWETLQTKKQPFTSEFKNKRKTGEFYYAKSTFTPILDKDGSIEFFVAVERDITKEKEIDKTKTEFVSLASHQLRTPLSAINWYAEMLLDGDAGQMNEEQKQYVDEIYKGNKRMVDLVEALLNVSRIDLGTFMVEPEPVKLSEISKSVIKELQPMIQKKNMHIEEHYGELPEIQADPRLTRIIIQNLLSNAVKYTGEKGTVSIDVRLLKKGSVFDKKKLFEDVVGITVADNGYGIPETQQDKIFDKLFRADNVKVKDTEGTGLGLYLVLSIIKEIQGDAWFTSKEGTGSTFYIIFPLSMQKKQGTKRLS